MGAYDVQNQAISAIPVIPSNTINIPAPGIKSSGTITAGTGVPNMTAGAGTFLTDGVQKGNSTGLLLYVGTTGDISVTTTQDNTVTLVNIGNASFIPISVRRVNTLGTTASNIIALL